MFSSHLYIISYYLSGTNRVGLQIMQAGSSPVLALSVSHAILALYDRDWSGRVQALTGIIVLRWALRQDIDSHGPANFQSTNLTKCWEINYCKGL